MTKLVEVLTYLNLLNTGDSKLLPGLSDLLQVLRSSLNIIGSSYDDFGGAVLVDTRK